jgi:hypothetical protein
MVGLHQAEAFGSVSANALNCSLAGLFSGRQIHSPLPRHIARRSESWICGWMVSHMRRSWVPQLNMLVIGAMPSCSMAVRALMWASISITTRSAWQSISKR